jgi:hypothetical protein
MSDRLGFDTAAAGRYLVGDVVAIALFVIIGEISHGIDPITQVAVVVDTFLPFLIGWVIVAPLLGAYASGTLESRLIAVTNIVPVWLVADGVGQVLRDSSFFHGSATPIFYLVAAAVGGFFLLAWRLFAWTVYGRLRPGSAPPL